MFSFRAISWGWLMVQPLFDEILCHTQTQLSSTANNYRLGWHVYCKPILHTDMSVHTVRVHIYPLSFCLHCSLQVWWQDDGRVWDGLWKVYLQTAVGWRELWSLCKRILSLPTVQPWVMIWINLPVCAFKIHLKLWIHMRCNDYVLGWVSWTDVCCDLNTQNTASIAST